MLYTIDLLCRCSSMRQRRWFVGLILAFIVCIFTPISFAQKPVAQLPRVYINSTYNLPIGGTTWAAHTSAQLTSALSSSAPGDVIVLDAGVTYSGNFTLPAKANPSGKWIYVISSQLADLPPAAACTTPWAPIAG